MNERIRELVLEAEHGNYGRMAFGEKLAELIVKECASIACNTDLEDIEGGDSAVLGAARDQILKHFGVEE
jgi:hypothetical protein